MRIGNISPTNPDSSIGIIELCKEFNSLFVIIRM
jgi:hypothetical protein